MRLEDFFQTIGPLLVGQATLAETAPRLYGAGAGGSAKDAERLAIYARFCRSHRFQVLDGVFPYCREAVLRGGGDGAWDELVEAYFRAHPMRSFELNENGVHLPTYLAEAAGQAGLPAFLPELADFEWWEWQTQIAPDVPEDRAPERGPLRLGATVELRRYGHDLVAWLDGAGAGAGAGERPPAPEPGESLVLFWRDLDLDVRREPASVIELLVLRTVNEGGSIEGLLAQGTALPRAELEETVADLRQAGILLGQP